MSTPLRQQLDAVLADLQAQQTRVREVTDQLSKLTASATSKDRTIEATVDSQGKLTSLKFRGTGHRKLAPAELAARIVDTVRTAQGDAVRQAGELLAEAMPDDPVVGLTPASSPDGGWDIDAMFTAAARVINEPLFTHDPKPSKER